MTCSMEDKFQHLGNRLEGLGNTYEMCNFPPHTEKHNYIALFPKTSGLKLSSKKADEENM